MKDPLRLLCLLCLLALCVLQSRPGSAEADAGSGLLISEVCTDNDFVFSMDEADYIEFYNAGGQDILLSDCELVVDDVTYALPDKTVGSHAYVCVRCDGSEVAVRLERDGCTVAIQSRDGSFRDEVTVPKSRSRVWTRENGLGVVATPGYANDEDGERACYEAGHGDLMITEAVSGNFRSVSTGKSIKRYADAVEITNVSERDIRLSHYCLSDSRKELNKYTLPDVILKPGEVYKLYCTTEKTTEACTGFKLSSTGEVLYLSKYGEEMIDVLNVPELPLDVSYGVKDGVHYYYSKPGIGHANGTGKRAVAAAPVLSCGSGYYSDTFEVTISGEGPFYYTTDLSVPTAESKLYTEPIKIKKDTTLRVVAIPDGCVASPAVTAVYSFNKENYSLPCVYITLPKSTLRSDKDSLFVNADEKGVEVPACVTFINSDGTIRFQQDAGLAISGQSSRNHTHRNFKVNFRGRYGEKNLNCQAFDDYDCSSFDSLLFRVGTNGNPIYDVLGTAIGIGVMDDVLYQRYQAVNLFVGGTYYGIYYMREHINENFVVNHLGGNEDTVDIIHTYKDVVSGSGKDWLALVDFCRNNSLKDEKNYQYVLDQIDVNSFIDYFIWRPYTGDSDQPNIKYVRSRDGDNKWHIVIYDMDWAFQDSSIGFERYTFVKFDEDKHNNLIIYGLLRNRNFRRLFLERMSELFNDALSPTRVIEVLDRLNNELKPDLEKSQKKWNSSVSGWNQKIRKIKAFVTGTKSSVSQERRLVLLAQVVKYMNLSAEDGEKYFPTLYKKLRNVK